MVKDEQLREALLELQLLQERETRTLEETRALLECLEAFSGAGSADAAISSIFASLQDKIGASLSMIVTRADDEGDFSILSCDEVAFLNQSLKPPFDPCGRTRNILDIAAIGPWAKGFDMSAYQGLIIVPLSDQAALLAFSAKPNSFRKDHMGLVKRLAGLAGDALRNARIATENELLAATIAGSSSGIAISDARHPDNPLVYVNKAFETLSGYTASEVLGQNCRFLSVESPDSQERARLREAIKSSTAGKFLLHNRRKTGELFWNELTLYPVYDSQGQIKNLVATQSDVTDRVELKAREIEMTKQMIRLQREETISQLTAGVAHDFNNLLAVINGSATLIGMTENLAPDLIQHVNRISSAGAQASKLITQLLDVGTDAEADGVFELASIFTDLPSLVQTSLPKAIDLTIEQHGSDLVLQGNLGSLSQILINLILNACHAFDGNSGYIRLSATTLKNRTPRPLQVGELHDGKDYAQIQVRDNGTGMSVETAAQIFEPYFTTKGRSGTGLGLATAAMQIRALGGGIEVDTQLGVGTTFTMYWPLAIQPVIAGEAGDANKVSLKGMIIIVVDDEVNVGSVIASYLEALGAEVACCQDPRDAVEALEEDPQAWSAVITDYDMPHMNGGALVERIRRVAPTVPIYVVTALAKRLSDPRLSEGQVNAILPKPINMAQLSQALSEHVKAD